MIKFGNAEFSIFGEDYYFSPHLAKNKTATTTAIFNPLKIYQIQKIIEIILPTVCQQIIIDKFYLYK